MAHGLVEIGFVARELGVAPSTLRTWERRYHLVVPHRDENGQRLYDPEQVRCLRRVRAQMRRGLRARAAHDVAARSTALDVSHVELEPTRNAPRQARRAIDEFLGGHGNERFAFFLRLIASELVNNAVLHGDGLGPISIDLELAESCAEIRVHNSTGGGRMRFESLRARRRRTAGRGLEIIDALAEAWTIETGPAGTTIVVRLRHDTE